MANQQFFASSLRYHNSLYSFKITARKIDAKNIGVVAIVPIHKGEIVAIQVGSIQTSSEYHAMSFELQRYPLQIGDHCYISTTKKSQFDIAEYFNHSCDPNIGVVGHNVFVAMRRIPSGEELRYDYAMSDTTAADMGWDCTCGTRLCRKKITPNDWKLPQLQQRYGRFFSRYILDKIDRQGKRHPSAH